VSAARPNGWVPCQLHEVALNLRERAKPQNYPDLPFVGMDKVEPHSMQISGTVPAGEMKSSAVHFLPGDILYGRLRPYLNKVAEAPYEGLASAEFIALTAPYGVVSSFIRYRLHSAEFVAFASNLDTGDRPRVDFDQIGGFGLLLPPAPEQRRITSVLDSYFTRLGAAEQALERVQANLKRYRASVLKAAVEGRLVPTEAELARREGREYEPAEALLERILVERRKRWEEAELDKMRAKGKEPKGEKWKAKYKEPARPDLSELPELPDGWCWATWEQVGFSQNGRAFPSKEYQETGVKLLRPGNLQPDGSVSWDQQNTRRLPQQWERRHPSYVVGPRALVVNLTAQSLADEFLGRACMTGAAEHCLLNQRIARLTPVLLNGRYVLWVLKSPLFRQFVASLNTGSLIQHMFTSQLANFTMPIPPLAEQQRIEREVERLVSFAAHVELVLDHKGPSLQMLRQSILKWAFEGKLADQDPNDEPASVLLERIRAERAAEKPMARRGRRRKGGRS